MTIKKKYYGIFRTISELQYMIYGFGHFVIQKVGHSRGMGPSSIVIDDGQSKDQACWTALPSWDSQWWITISESKSEFRFAKWFKFPLALTARPSKPDLACSISMASGPSRPRSAHNQLRSPPLHAHAPRTRRAPIESRAIALRCYAAATPLRYLIGVRSGGAAHRLPTK